MTGFKLILVVASLGAASAAAETNLPLDAVAGVVGSGDQLRLRLATSGGVAGRTLSIGDEFADGWKLKSLNPSEAVLERGGQSQRIGLNSTGALSAVADQSVQTEIQVITAELERRTALEQGLLKEYFAAYDKVRAPGVPPGHFNGAFAYQVWGAERYAAFEENDRALGPLRREKARLEALASGDDARSRYLNGLAVAGPDFFVVRNGDSGAGAMAAGLPSTVGYAYEPLVGDPQQGFPAERRMVKCFTPLSIAVGAYCP